ncbi:hypothetical protein VP01_3866g2 [Puccinia sorghi]|uniref:Uncharacterized protein n=1 Tax=Puccinia sorghi TaxID=27349 RepID=A0A0L6UTU8_9BASI|nr:hypothetical protein VP01_3866g2 [Puccinia sorghi]
MNAGSSGHAPALTAKADTKASVPDEHSNVETLHQDLHHHSREEYEAWETVEADEELQRIVNRDYFSSKMIENQSVIESITEEAVGWLRARPHERAYQLFEELFVSSPNIAIGQLLDEKDHLYLVKLGRKTAQWIKPRDPENKVVLSLQSTQRQLRQSSAEGLGVRISPALSELLVHIQRAPILQILRNDQENSRMTNSINSPRKPGTSTTTGTSSSIGELLHHVFESSLLATKDKRVSAESFLQVLDASLVWKLNNDHLERFIDRCLADKSIAPETSLGIFHPESQLFLLKIDHNTVEWVHPRSHKQTRKSKKHGLMGSVFTHEKSGQEIV